MANGSTKRRPGPSSRRNPPPSAVVSSGAGRQVEAPAGIDPALLARITAALEDHRPVGLSREQRAVVDAFGDDFASRRMLGDLAAMLGIPKATILTYRQRSGESR